MNRQKKNKDFKPGKRKRAFESTRIPEEDVYMDRRYWPWIMYTYQRKITEQEWLGAMT